MMFWLTKRMGRVDTEAKQALNQFFFRSTDRQYRVEVVDLSPFHNPCEGDLDQSYYLPP